MHFGFTDDQVALRDTVRELLAKECRPEVVRAAWSGSWSRTLWDGLAEMGVLALRAPEASGGLGMDEVDLVGVLEEAGRSAAPAPVAEAAAVAVPLLAEAGGDLAERWLPAVISGQVVTTVGAVDGSAPVPYGAQADLLLLGHGQEVHAVAAADVTLAPLPAVDRGRPLYAVTWSPSPASLLAEGGLVALAFDRGALAAAAQLIGLARHLIETTVGYATQRRQFGRPIGSFQAVKHHLADALLAVEFAAPATYRAAWSVARGDPRRCAHVSMAKALASDAAMLASRVALQVHGAIGYSWEHDLHLWMKRVWALAGSWGDAAWHRDRVASAIIDGSDTRGDA